MFFVVATSETHVDRGILTSMNPVLPLVISDRWHCIILVFRTASIQRCYNYPIQIIEAFGYALFPLLKICEDVAPDQIHRKITNLATASSISSRSFGYAAGRFISN
jgi:hypothetical protein